MDGASILWKSAGKAADAAEIMGITAARLKSLGLVDKVVSEPVGGAHRDPERMAQNLGKALQEARHAVAAPREEDRLDLGVLHEGEIAARAGQRISCSPSSFWRRALLTLPISRRSN